jgi:hypothetical protein
VDERDWQRLVEQLRNGDCTPFLGAGACAGALPTGSELGRQWAERYQYPFQDGSNLPEVMQYASIVEGDPVTVKQRVARELSSLPDPDFTDPAEPHALLAELPINVYLTTNYDDFMTRALHRAGKRPVTAVCPWYRGAEVDAHMPLPGGYRTQLPGTYQPRGDEPLVYHLHGSLRYPPSLVLTEQDYAEFLVNLAKDLGEDAKRVVPTQILSALARQPLLFIGYSLRDWSFRMLFHGFVGAVPDVLRRRHVSVQLSPAADMEGPEERRQAEDYLTRYFSKLNISVFWGTAADFCTELRDRMGSL